jgi:hypothetical protein
MTKKAITPDTVRERLRELHNTLSLSFRKIAALPEFTPIPFGTLSAIYNGYPIPKKWYARLEMQLIIPIQACPRHGVVHCYDCETQVVKAAPKPRNYTDLWSMPTAILRKALVNRESY